jgi:hypothetical protein
MFSECAMETELQAAVIGIVAGALGYWIATFWMRPILQYRGVRSRVLIDLVYYAQIIDPAGLSERMERLYHERVESNRRRSAELTACLLELPCWYIWWLRRRGHNPERAASDLIGFSNTREYGAADRRVERIKSALGLNTEVL